MTQWYREIFVVLPHERLAAVLRGNIQSFQNVSSPFIDHLPPDMRKIWLCVSIRILWEISFPPLGGGLKNS